MKKYVGIIAVLICMPSLSACAIGSALGAGAQIASTAVSIGAKVSKTGAGVATNAVKKASNTVVGDQDK